MIAAILTPLLLAACTVAGEVSSDRALPIEGVAVFDAARDVLLGATAADGSFLVDADPDEEGEVVLEFRHDDWLTRVERIACDTRASLSLFPRVYTLEGFQVSATRLERNYESSPVRVERLDEEDVVEAAGSSPSFGQAVQQLPGVGAIGRDGLTSAPTIRGFGRGRSLVLVEGMRMSADRGVGASGSFLDPFLVRDLSVVRGASGVAYGSGAIGGVFLVGLGTPTNDRSVSSRFETTTNGDGRLFAVRGGGEVGAGWRALGGGFYRATDDYEFPEGDGMDAGEARNSGFENAGGMVAAERSVSGGTLRISGLGTFASDIGRPTTRAGRLDTIESEDHALAAVRWSQSRGDDDRTELSFGVHRPKTVNRAERFDDVGERTRTSHLENVSTDLSVALLRERPQTDGSWLMGLDAFARAGAEADETTVRFSGGAPQPATATPLIDAGRRFDLGFFTGWKRPIGLFGEFRFAGRLDWATRNATDRSDVSWFAPSLSAGAVFPLDETWALTAAAGRSFRAPRLQELYFQGDRPGGSRLANPDLEPETAWSIEGGVRAARGPWSSEAVLWGVAANDLIVQLPVDAAADTLRYQNESQGRLGGVEFAVNWRPTDDRARASFAYALVVGEDGDGVPLPDVPGGEVRLAGALRAWSSERAIVRVRSALRAGAAKTPLPDGIDERGYSAWLGPTDIGGDEVAHPGFARWDLGVKVSWSDRVALDLAVDNVLDARYVDRPESNAYPQPGRSLRFALTLGED